VLTVTADGFAQVRRVDFTGGGGLAGIANYGELRRVRSWVYGNEGQYGGLVDAGSSGCASTASWRASRPVPSHPSATITRGRR